MKLPFMKRSAEEEEEFLADEEFMDEEDAAAAVWDEEDSTQSRAALLLAFVLPVFIMIGILAGKEIYPFGHNSFLRTDMYHQYAPFFAEFARILKNGGSLTYSFEIGLGTNFQALYAYYLSSPLNWLVFFVPSSLIVEFMTYMIVLKIGACGLTMSYYLKKHFRTGSLAITFFGVCYAMCAYIAAYSWNIMWMDSLWLAPLILLGAERLLRESKPMLYVITLGLAILCNYYIAIMILIFLIAYYFCEMIAMPDLTIEKFFERGVLYAVCSFLALGAAAIMVIPAFFGLMSTASANSDFPSELTSYFSILEMLVRHMVNVDVEIGLDHWPNIYSGVACFFLMPIYVISPKIPARQKVAQIGMLIFLLLGFSLNIPNYIWHGLHFPNSLPCRQSFLYTIVLLTMCFEGVLNLRYLSKGQIAACLWGDIAFLLILQRIIDEDDVAWYCYYLTIAFILAYVLLVWLWKSRKLQAMTAIGIALVLVTGETGMNMAVTSVTTVDRDEYWKNTENYQTLVSDAEQMDSSNFFRVEKDTRRTKNDAAWIGYNSASIFSSATEAGISDFYKLFGMEGNTNAYSFTGATPLMESILSVRYRISSYELDTTDLMEYVEWEDTTYLYRNLYTLPLGFMIPDTLDDYFTYYTGNDPALAQNTLVDMTAGTGDVLEEVAVDDNFDECSIPIVEDGHYYAYIRNHEVESVTVETDTTTDTVDNVDRGFLVDLGICTAGDNVTITSDNGEDLNASAYRFSDENFIAWYQKMSEQAMTVTNVANDRSETSITGTVTALTDNTLFLSIPFETGWTVTVDGVETTTDAFADAFLSIPLTAGSHTIVMTYETPGEKVAIIVTLGSLLGIVLLAVIFGILGRRKKEDPDPLDPEDPEKRRRKRGKKKADRGSEDRGNPESGDNRAGHGNPESGSDGAGHDSSAEAGSEVNGGDAAAHDAAGYPAPARRVSDAPRINDMNRINQAAAASHAAEQPAQEAPEPEILLEDEDFLEIEPEPAQDPDILQIVSESAQDKH